MRYVKYHETDGQTGGGQKWRDVTEHVDSAVWWPREGGVDRSSPVRYLNGEMRLKKDLASSISIGQFRIEVCPITQFIRGDALFTLTLQYAIEVHSFDAAAFASTDKGPLLTEPVEIVTAYATGPRPKSYPPTNLVNHDPSIVEWERNEFFVSSAFN